MKILVTGGAGYKGSVLVPKLLNLGHHVHVLDTFWFGDFLGEHENLSKQVGDVCNVDEIDLNDIDTIIHLSSIANDPCGDLNQTLTWEVSALSTMQLADKAKRTGNVSQFIYASSGSVYGLKDEDQVTEDLPLTPISAYNKTKMVSERVLLSYASDFVVQIVRPATVCGLSPRMRLDVSVNMLTMQALTNQKITVFGGQQMRPNIHIEDICNVYLHFLQHPEFTGIYNAGFENVSIMQIAELARRYANADIAVTESNDPRSYRVNSDKLLATGFKPTKTIEDAVQEIAAAYRAGQLLNEPHFHNLNWMQTTEVAV
ncbi:MAG: SDR family oxidoreductase [Rhodobacteraceae bacterium]|nr:SDR family oxidoreductase [Paracoccaceae bacterium]